MSAPNPWLELIAYNTADLKMKRRIRIWWTIRGTFVILFILYVLKDAF